jgi:hypothetical protein
VKSFISSAKHLLESVNNAMTTETRRIPRSSSKSSAAPKQFSFDSITVPLSAEKLNILRLILAWSCVSNILKARLKSKVSEADFNTAFVQSPRLTEASVASILGHECAWKLTTGEQKTYSSKFFGGKRTLRDVISSMVRLSGWLPVVWIHQEVEMNKVMSLFAIARNVFSEDVVWFLQEFQLLFPHVDFFGEFPYGDDKNKRMYALFYQPTLPKKAINRLKELYNGLDKCIYLQVFLDNDCAIHLKGCNEMNVGNIQDIIWGDSNRFDWKFKEQVVKSEQRIEFPHPYSVDQSGSLIVDLPLGFKILSGCRSLYKQNKLKLRPISYYGPDGQSSSANSDATDVRRLVPGTAEYAAAKVTEFEQRKGAGDNEIDTCTVMISLLTPTWSNMVRLSKVSVSKNSYLSTCCHCDNDSVMFCAAYNIMDALLPTGDVMSYAEGVTLLPVGGRWVSLAKLCIGSDISESEVFCSSKTKKKAPAKSAAGQAQDAAPVLVYNGDINHKIGEADRRNCDEVCLYFDHIINEPLRYNPELKAMISSIFSEWIMAYGANNSYAAAMAHDIDLGKDDEVDWPANSPRDPMSGPDDGWGAGDNWGGMDWEESVVVEHPIDIDATESSMIPDIRAAIATPSPAPSYNPKLAKQSDSVDVSAGKSKRQDIKLVPSSVVRKQGKQTKPESSGKPPKAASKQAGGSGPVSASSAVSNAATPTSPAVKIVPLSTSPAASSSNARLVDASAAAAPVQSGPPSAGIEADSDIDSDELEEWEKLEDANFMERFANIDLGEGLPRGQLPADTSGKKLIECELCGLLLLSGKDLRQHVVDEHAGMVLECCECEFCGALLSSRSRLQQHLKKDHAAHAGHSMAVLDAPAQVHGSGTRTKKDHKEQRDQRDRKEHKICDICDKKLDPRPAHVQRRVPLKCFCSCRTGPAARGKTSTSSSSAAAEEPLEDRVNVTPRILKMPKPAVVTLTAAIPVDPKKDAKKEARSLRRRTCEYCSVVFETKAQVEEHEKTEHAKVKCSVCNKSLNPHLLSIQQHMLAKHGLTAAGSEN